MKYSHILSEVMATPWAIRPEKLNAIMAFLRLKSEGINLTADDVALVKQQPREPYLLEASGEMEAEGQPGTASRSRAGAVAVLPLFGTILHRMGTLSEFSGGTSTERFTGWLRAALADDGVSSVVIDVDSPGGTVTGVPELGDEIYKARDSKPIIAVANGQAASAAYWLASQASEFVATPSSEVGSIGVFAAHEDISKAAEREGVRVTLVSAGKYKTEANPFEPLSDEARTALQSKVNDYYARFTKAVARGRGVTVAAVQSGFGEGRMVSADKAKSDGMIDRIATLDQTLRRLGARQGVRKLPESFRAEQVTTAPKLPSAAMRRREHELSLYQ
ncbi:MAG TPA: S49 family peptidase [Vicinamibacterales bacterium]|nr:S49 family peptidase [Vicinamibacterales bacterium]